VPTRAAPHHSVNELVGPRSALVRKLTEAYWAELETAATYLASSTNREGITAGRIARRVCDAITSNLVHAQRLAVRIKQLHGPVPSPDDFSARQLALGPPAEPHDNASVLEGAIEAATAAIARYQGIVAASPEAADWVTRDLAVQLIREKEIHRQWLQGSLVELGESEASAI
jgi:bacterioferritin